MPALYTHYLFASEVMKKDEKYPSLYLLASQGPDCFFFYGNSLKIRKDKQIRSSFGHMLHKINIAKTYEQMIRYALQDDQNKEMLLSFIRGFMVHYCLDRNAHPYIFYRSGFLKEDDTTHDAKFYSLAHMNFETYIDVLMKEEKAFFKQPKELVNMSKEEGIAVSHMFHQVAKDVFSVDIGKKTYYQAYKDFRFVEKFLNSKRGGKKRFFAKHMHNTTLFALSYPEGLTNDDIYDYMNHNHQEWKHPVTGKTSHESFLDLFEKAKLDVEKVDEILTNAKAGKNVEKALIDFVSDINHNGTKVGEKMQFMHFLCEDGKLFY